MKGSYNSIQGKIISEWNRNGENFRLHVVIPPNTTATIYFPATNATPITEGDKKIGEIKNIKFIHSDNAHTAFIVGSGEYTFETSHFN